MGIEIDTEGEYIILPLTTGALMSKNESLFEKGTPSPLLN